MNDALLQDLLDFVRSRYFGKYRGVVTDVDASTMRIKASIPSVLGGISSGWASPCVPYAGSQVGFMMLPDVGTGVWIEFEGGDVSYPIWTGFYWNSGDIPSSASATVRTIVTQSGSLAFDDGGSSVTLQDSNDNSLTIDSSGATTKAGSGQVEVGSSGVSINNGAFEVS